MNIQDHHGPINIHTHTLTCAHLFTGLTLSILKPNYLPDQASFCIIQFLTIISLLRYLTFLQLRLRAVDQRCSGVLWSLNQIIGHSTGEINESNVHGTYNLNAISFTIHRRKEVFSRPLVCIPTGF